MKCQRIGPFYMTHSTWKIYKFPFEYLSFERLKDHFNKTDLNIFNKPNGLHFANLPFEFPFFIPVSPKRSLHVTFFHTKIGLKAILRTSMVLVQSVRIDAFLWHCVIQNGAGRYDAMSWRRIFELRSKFVPRPWKLEIFAETAAGSARDQRQLSAPYTICALGCQCPMILRRCSVPY